VYMQENDTSPLTMTYVPPLEANAVNLRGYCEGTGTLNIAARMFSDIASLVSYKLLVTTPSKIKWSSVLKKKMLTDLYQTQLFLDLIHI